ncbi:MAG: discoidin domain-containing protein [Clostridia bacterium]|nr:discoidin domain-containing protein [Clostridia bacterium]
MKRIICFVLALLLIFSAAACGVNGPADTNIETAPRGTAESETLNPDTAAESVTEPVPAEPLRDKAALFVGDALMTEVTADGQKKKSLAEAVAEKLEISDVKNVSTDGVCISQIPVPYGPTAASLLEAESGNKYGIVIIEGGITDAARAVDIGRIVPKSADMTKPEDLDLYKFAGGFENTLLTAKKLFADACIGCVIAPKLTSDRGSASDMRRYAEVMRLACEKWGVFVLDLYDEETGIEYKPETGLTASTDMNVYQGNGPEYAVDGDTSTLFWSNGGAYDGSTFTVDLGVLSEVSGINLIMGSERYPNNYIHKGVLEYSSDGENYTKLCDLNKTNRVTKCGEYFKARYVRIRSTAFDKEWPLITEFEITAEPVPGADTGDLYRPIRMSAADYEKLTERTAEFIREIHTMKREPVFKIGPGVCDLASVLADKRVVYYGDSICDKTFHDDPARTVYYSYGGRISELYGAKMINRGKNSASLSTVRGENTIIAQTGADLKRSVDIIVIEGGVNDAMDSAPVGKISDMMRENFDPSKLKKSTLAGGLEEVLWTLTGNHSEAVIVYMILYKVDFDAGRCKDMTAYVEMIKALCDKWGVVYLDLYNDGWFNARFDIKSRVYSNDGLHPNAAGFDVLAPVLAEFMADTYVKAKQDKEE